MADATAIGDPVVRQDGIAKVTGMAKFPSDVPADGVAHAILLTSTIARGRIRSIDDSRARTIPGFLLLLSHENASDVVKPQRAFIGSENPTLQGPDIAHDGQIIGMVVAETLEVARECARAVRFDYEVLPASAGFDAEGAVSKPVSEVDERHVDPQLGDTGPALSAAHAKVDVRYSTPIQHHNSMELLTTTCWWSGNRLTVHEPSQFVLNRGYLAQCFGIPHEDIRVVSRYCGGGFGGKASGTARTVVTALAAKRLNRPVKLYATRDQGFTIYTYRAETRHHVQLAANDKGRLTAMVHEGWEVASRPSPYTVAGTDATARMYACPNISTRVNVVQADRNTPGFMRCPSEVPYMFALESAMDELAHELKIDPIELRRRNDTQTDPIDGRPYSSRSLMQCYDRGAELFGWKARDATPRSHRDGDWLVGWGCSTACYPANRGGSAARVSLDSSGKAKAQVAFHEIGNGAYTVVAQTAAAALGIPIRDVSVELGDTLLPVGNIAAGSNGTATTCNAVSNACAEILQKLNRGERESLRDAVDRVGGLVEATGNFVDPNLAPGALARLQRGIPAIASGVSAKGHIMFSFGAQFIEVRVHRLTGEVRVPRVAGVFAAGRIINRRTAHSQLTGGLIWGIGSALLEQTIVDPHSARYLNDNFADYLVAVNADIGDMQVEMIEEQDPFVNPMGIKGVGELGCSGTNAAVANAVFHATGKRIRDLPVRAHLLI